MTTDLLLIALLGSNSLLSFGLSPPDLLIGICQLAHQICLRSVALSSSVLAELALDSCQLSLGTGLQLPTNTLNYSQHCSSCNDNSGSTSLCYITGKFMPSVSV